MTIDMLKNNNEGSGFGRDCGLTPGIVGIIDRITSNSVTKYGERQVAGLNFLRSKLKNILKAETVPSETGIIKEA